MGNIGKFCHDNNTHDIISGINSTFISPGEDISITNRHYFEKRPKNILKGKQMNIFSSEDIAKEYEKSKNKFYRGFLLVLMVIHIIALITFLVVTIQLVWVLTNDLIF